jgi:hypothetical protein
VRWWRDVTQSDNIKYVIAAAAPDATREIAMNSQAETYPAAAGGQAEALAPGGALSRTTSAVTDLQALALPFSVLRSIYKLNFDGDITTPRLVPINNALLALLFESVAERVVVDEQWYCARYPDIGDAIASGAFESARHHYLKFGYLENRLPHYIPVDKAFYCASNKDILEKLRLGHIESVQQHFEEHGFKEGRLPSKSWRLF